MVDINQLFFELIQVAIGTRICLSHTPSADEWGELYAMSKKQSLVGVCFVGVQRLQQQRQDPTSTGSAQAEMLYLTWLGMAAKIQQRNEVVNRQCVELQAKLAADGLKSVILKGQGVATLYKLHEGRRTKDENNDLSMLRQSGDIDIWVLPNEGEPEKEHIARVVRYAKEFNPESHFSGKHIDLSVFADTEVELHVTPAKMNCPWHERRLKAWFQEQSSKFQVISEGFNVPTTEFNLIYLLLHCYDHLLFEGVGLRQIMDYYFVLLLLDKKGSAKKAVLTKTEKTAAASAESRNEPLANDCSFEIVSQLPSSANHSSATLSGNADTSAKNIKNICDTLSSLGLLKFASAMLWVIDYVFGDLKLSKTMKLFETMGIKPNEKEGRFLLNEIMTGGNFGKYGKDSVMEGHAKGKSAFAIASMKHKMRFLTHYPSEVLWAPYQMLVYYLETIIKKRK